MKRLIAFVAASALLLSAVVLQSTLLGDTQAQTQVSSYAVLQHGCGSQDLHVVRYTPESSPDGRALVATWCG